MSDTKMMFEEECGFRKWSLGVSEDAAVVVRFHHYPNVGEILLHDLVGDDLARLANMFSKASEYYKALRVKNQIEKEATERTA